MRFTLLVSLLAIATCATPASSQGAGVPYQHHILSMFESSTSTIPTEGLFLMNRLGTCKLVQGLSTSGRGNAEVNAVQLDPVNANIWIGGVGATSGGHLDVISLDNSCNVSSWKHWGVATSTVQTRNPRIHGITFDDLGNPVASAGGGVWLFDRDNPGNGLRIAMSTNTSTIGGICRDAGGNLLYGQSDGSLFFLPKNRDCTYTYGGVLIGNVTPASTSPIVHSVELSANGTELYFTTGSAVGWFSLPAGPTATSTSPQRMNWIEFDPQFGDFALVTAGAAPDRVYLATASSTPALNYTAFCTLPPAGNNGTPSCIDTADGRDGDATVLPGCPGRNTAFTLEAVVSCPPGSTAGIFVAAPTLGVPPQLVAFSSNVPANGRLSVAFPNLALAQGVPAGLLVFSGACVDSNNQLTTGPPVIWPLN